MAEISARPRVDIAINFQVNEAEARALDALAGYGDDAFVKAFYEELGKAYMEKHEAGLRKFLTSIRCSLPPILSQLDNAKKAFAEPANRVNQQ